MSLVILIMTIKHDFLTDLRFHEFREVTLEEVKMTVKKAPSNLASLTPYLPYLLKESEKVNSHRN